MTHQRPNLCCLAVSIYDQHSYFWPQSWIMERRSPKKSFKIMHGNSHFIGIFGLLCFKKSNTGLLSIILNAFLSPLSILECCFSVRTKMLVMWQTQPCSFCGPETVMFHSSSSVESWNSQVRHKGARSLGCVATQWTHLRCSFIQCRGGVPFCAHT